MPESQLKTKWYIFYDSWSIHLEEKEEFICQVYNNNNNNRKKDTPTGCQGGYTPINAGRL